MIVCAGHSSCLFLRCATAASWWVYHRGDVWGSFTSGPHQPQPSSGAGWASPLAREERGGRYPTPSLTHHLSGIVADWLQTMGADTRAEHETLALSTRFVVSTGSRCRVRSD